MSSFLDKITDPELKRKVLENLAETDKFVKLVEKKDVPKAVEERKVNELIFNHFMIIRENKVNLWLSLFIKNVKFLVDSYNLKKYEADEYILKKVGGNWTGAYSDIINKTHKMDISVILHYAIVIGYTFNVEPITLLTKDVESMWKRNLYSPF